MDQYSDVTRLLCSCAILKGRAFRQTLEEHFKDKHIATAPEIGLDMHMLMQVVARVEAMEERRNEIRRRFGWGFLVLAIIVIVMFGSSTGLGAIVVVLLIFGLPLQWLQANAQDDHDPKKLLDDFRLKGYDHAKVIQKYEDQGVPYEIEPGLPKPDQNIVVYSGFSPFIGAGTRWRRHWSFAINVTYGKENELGALLDPIPFEVLEVYDHVEQQLSKLEFPGMEIQDMLFVNGRDIRDKDAILSRPWARPIQTLSEEVAQGYMTTSDPQIRHYKWIRIHYGNDSLVLSFFLRFSLRGNNLFSEFATYLLTPPADDYRELDISRNKIEKEHWYTPILKFMGKLTSMIVMIPFSVILGLFQPLELVSEFISSIFDKSEQKREEAIMEEIQQNPLYDWGASSSVRELVASHRFDHYFQQLDEDMYSKIVERTILDAIVGFLEEHNVNVADIRERRTTILNQGVMVQGGNIDADVLAVGEGAQAQQSNTNREKD